MKADESVSLSDKLLLAAIALVDGSLEKAFAAEDLVVAAWQSDPSSFGLRTHESKHPDSNKVYTKIDGKQGLVGKGWLAKAGERMLRLTPVGLSRASRLSVNKDTALLGKLDRALQDTVARILSDPNFLAWRADPTKPSRFRGAGAFWGIAPGTPSQLVRERVLGVERALQHALEAIDERGIDGVLKHRGEVLFERSDVEQCLAFQRTLQERFKKDLQVLDPEGIYA
jgi:hypothetical protein